MRSTHDGIMYCRFRGKPSSCKNKEDMYRLLWIQGIVFVGLDGRHRRVNAEVRKERLLAIYLCYVGIEGNHLHMNAKV